MGQELTDIDPDEVAIVRRGSIGRRFSFMKSADDKLELAKSVADALSDPFEGEASLVDALRKSGVDEDAQEGLIAAARILKGFAGDLPDSFNVDFAALLKAKKEVAPADIASRADLEKAVAAFAGDATQKAALIAKADELDATDALPKDWISKDDRTKELKMGAGLSVPVRKEDGTWDTSGVADADTRAFYDTILKALDDSGAANVKLTERVEKAEKRSVELEGQLTDRELIAKAETDFKNVAKAEELTPILKAAKASFDDETYAQLEELLKSADARIETGDLFAEIREKPAVKDALQKQAALESGSGDAWAEIERLAKSVVEKSDDEISEAQAVDRVLKTSEGRELYARYLVETSGGVR